VRRGRGPAPDRRLEDARPAGRLRFRLSDEGAQGRELRTLALRGVARLELVVMEGGLGHHASPGARGVEACKDRLLHASQRLRRL